MIIWSFWLSSYFIFGILLGAILSASECDDKLSLGDLLNDGGFWFCVFLWPIALVIIPFAFYSRYKPYLDKIVIYRKKK